ncbi:Rho guanine nucleotide exchange factor 25 [Pseudolycoriella hygida]|uniref:Rho guanine nucleotide exchange factor 25 n=1 Tax=Pseudolycoriella hygida TaxID=35572 RepID=A0A9Q0S8N0_9DIPT|nr:Rho guanine nucleotide exchange factor 25 [Pseudolycoriella hygida]
MEKKEKPQVPAKPRNLSVSERARHFDLLLSEASQVVRCKPIIRSSKSESSSENRLSQNSNATTELDETVQMNDVDERTSDETHITTEEIVNDEESSDDSVYFGFEDREEHIYDEIVDVPEVSNTVEEILEVEKLYIDKLNFTVDNYIEPSRLMGDQMKAVFGNIEEIKQFHENIFYPDLKQCNKDLKRVLECFSKHIEADNFYPYVVYAMNKKRSDEERNKPAFKSFFENCQNKIGDKLGLHSLLTEPFQRFFKYQNLIESLLKKIKNNELNFVEIAATSKALHDVKKLLNTANKSMALTEIINSKINLMNQGKFLTQNEFQIFDYNHKRKYKGNIFVFQHCVVCTERLSTSKLQFKAYFPNDTSHIECINENKFLLYERNNYKIEVSSDAMAIQQMMKQIRQILTSDTEDRSSAMSNVSYSKSSESKVHTLTKELDASLEWSKRSDSYDSLMVLTEKETNTVSADNRKSNSDESSVESGEYVGSQSDECNEKQQFKEMIKNFNKFYEKVANKVVTASTVYREEVHSTAVQEHPRDHQSSTEIIEEMLANEKDYVRRLSIAIQTYLTHDDPDNPTEAVKTKIVKIFGNFQQIRDFHENTFYLHISDCKNDVTKLANLFTKFTQEGIFSNYILYAMNHNNTQSMRSMRPYREFFELRQKEVGDSQGLEYYLFLPFQHFNKYQSFMDRIISTLNIDTETAVMAACSKAMKNIERLIKDIHTSWTNSDTHVRRRPIRKLSTIVLNGIQHIRRH